MSQSTPVQLKPDEKNMKDLETMRGRFPQLKRTSHLVAKALDIAANTLYVELVPEEEKLFRQLEDRYPAFRNDRESIMHIVLQWLREHLAAEESHRLTILRLDATTAEIREDVKAVMAVLEIESNAKS